MVTVQGANKLIVFSLVALCNVLPGVIALPAVDNISPNGRNTTFAPMMATPPIVLVGAVANGQANGNILGGSATYGVQVALYDSNWKLIIASAESAQKPWMWTKDDGYDGLANFAWGEGYSVNQDVMGGHKGNFGWDDRFDFIEAQQYVFTKEQGQKAAYILFTVENPNGEGGKWRADIGGFWYGSHASGPWDWNNPGCGHGGDPCCTDCAQVKYAEWKEYVKDLGYEASSPAPIHASIMSQNLDGTARANRHLALFISFRSEGRVDPAGGNFCDPAKGEHCCYVKKKDYSGKDNYEHGLEDASQNCWLYKPRYFCQQNEVWFKGSLMDDKMQDGKPIKVFFQDGAELGLPLSNAMWHFTLANTAACSNVCDAMNDKGKWVGMDQCDITWSSQASMNGGAKGKGLGKVTVRGYGRISGYYYMQDWANWYDLANQDNFGYPLNFGAIYHENEHKIRSALVFLVSSGSYDDNLAHDVRDVAMVWGVKRGDGNMQLSADGWLPDNGNDGNRQSFVYDVKQVGNWPDAADGIELYGEGSSAWHTFMQASDDILKLQASGVTFFATTMVSGNAGAPMNLGAYGDIPVKRADHLKLGHMTAQGVWIHRSNHWEGGWDNRGGIVDTRSCPREGFVMSNLKVDDLYIPWLGQDNSVNPHTNKKEVNSVDALFALGSLGDDAVKFFFCQASGGGDGPVLMDSTFSNFNVNVEPAMYSMLYSAYENGVKAPATYENLNFENVIIWPDGDHGGNWYAACPAPKGQGDKCGAKSGKGVTNFAFCYSGWQTGNEPCASTNPGGLITSKLCTNSDVNGQKAYACFF